MKQILHYQMKHFKSLNKKSSKMQCSSLNVLKHGIVVKIKIYTVSQKHLPS